MQKSDNKQTKNAHRQVQTSTTTGRRYLNRSSSDISSVPISISPSIKRFNSPAQPTISDMKSPSSCPEPKITATSSEKSEPVPSHPIQKKVSCCMCAHKSLSSNPKKMSAQELKDAAIKKALASAAGTPETENSTPKQSQKRQKSKIHFGFGRIFLALTCAAAAVFAIVYFVNLNTPDVALKVTAMQTGIEASYPNYVPRDYSLTDITSEEGKITLNFKNTNNNSDNTSSSESSFSLTEEQSSWDSNALLNNFVKEEYGENYSTIKEQGLTIYISGSNAAWVNGGKIFKIKTTSGSLTKKQITSIAASL